MLIIVDKRMPDEAKQNLRKYGELIEFATSGITYEAISGHPDIFFCQTPSGIIAAPNTPRVYLEILTNNRINFKPGKLPVGKSYPETAHYNAVVTNRYLIHNLLITDPAIQSLVSDIGPLSLNLIPLYLNQGYTRCNLLEVGMEQFITSDKGIEKNLLERGIHVYFMSPEGILLPGFNHGFLGGCCGILGNKIFISGSLHFIKRGEELYTFLKKADLEIIELYNGPLFDGGSILFCD